ncbi:division/cell wall cluster transcriptional repressor MraZ [Caldovatus aquaticus]|uniref:Transcriptional regulator MraZ n=1 Tax=Caldovatus aquaticus TaxID=2865671 RepID=A0ABS7EY04_9PROT|nr:division/cell wall cluster transcriptional repressor MraZ [Caldovatus aquaticus]MBW8268230.1 division/cell wall cluster transcriptional repressor MraZ [Caldovatus aquaticus]
MTQFLGTHLGKLDRKGRISVPAPYRAALQRFGSDILILRPSHSLPCIEAHPESEFQRLTSGLQHLDAFSEQQDDLATALFTEAHAVQPDGEGRLVLPEPLVAHAGLTDAVAFLGLGRLFQIWEPEAAKRRIAEARLRVRERGMTLPAPPAIAPPPANSPLNPTPRDVP